MIPFGPKVKLAVVAVAILAIGYSGWMARGWFEDSKDLAAMEAQKALADEIRSDMGQVARTVEDQLKGLKANERIIDRGIIREIQKPVFRNVCIPPGGDAFGLLRSIANGEAPGKPDDEGSQNTTPAD
ncbi:hypothetical protein [Marinobacter algicola]|uniref:Uncharacterized protein n=1 Tax=Marinobacter algicola DG893 TaxID=443152 RepID=A6F0K8_9GAMM|nr:hypothetical protein [Marinobacter algicola]EDM47769.1 hypothetical protein MDG893_20654 [Marinobacter algicola DG893]